MKKFVKCSHCGNCEWFDVDVSIAKFDTDEYEFLQNECSKIQKRIDRLQYKHDFEDLSSCQLEKVNMQISTLTKIKYLLSFGVEK